MEKEIYLFLAAVVTVVDITVATLIFRSKRKTANYLGITLLAAALVEISYTCSITVGSYFAMKCSLAVFFGTIPVMLMFLLTHIMSYTGVQFRKRERLLMGLGWALVLADVAVQAVNPFREIVMNFSYHPEYVVVWSFEPLLLYHLHLVLCYLQVAGVVVCLIRKLLTTPVVYRGKYYTLVVGLFVAVGVNAICLIFQGNGMPDYSQLTYSLLGCILYWDMFHSGQRALLNSVRHVILDELGHPLVLFGQDNLVAERNPPAEFLFPSGLRDPEVSMAEFLEFWGFDCAYAEAEDNTSFRWNYESGQRQTTYRVDYRVIRDKRNRVIGRMLMFTDATLGVDLLTGFLSKSAFERHFRMIDVAKYFPAAVAIFDINRLSEINRTHGEDIGDQCIRVLADAMRAHCPQNARFARLNDANLLAAVPYTTLQDMRTYMQAIREACSQNAPEGVTLEIQSAISTADWEQPSLRQAVNDAMSSMRSKKLMDQSSAHSSLLDSLAETMMEADQTTRDHVARTKSMGELLGQRLNFTDLQISDLSLLCLLHDIGKLGIPLEILNKPSVLDATEWEVMKSHAEKGYHIARASSELRHISEYIRYHHEAWNGGGYPSGLKGEEIPLLSRVICIIDAYDAMINDRPYHKAISDAAARAELRRCAGTQFDPSLVKEFLTLLEEIKPLTEAAADTAAARPTAARQTVPPPESSDVRLVKSCQYLLDENNYIISVDDKFTQFTGYTWEDVERRRLDQLALIPPEDRDVYKLLVAEQLEKTGQARLEHRILRKDGGTLYVICHGKKRFDPYLKREVSKLTIIPAADTLAVQTAQMQEREIARRQQIQLSKTLQRDPLTGVMNRAAFVSALEAGLNRTDKVPVFVIMDLDNFKQYNDTYGHLEGDRMLIRMAGLLQRQVLPDGFAGRLGGDEFAAVFFVTAGESAAREAAQRAEIMFRTVSRVINGAENSATVSMGAVLAEKGRADTFFKLYQLADRALYRSKQKGRNCLTIAEP